MKKERISLNSCYEILYITCLALGLLLTGNYLGGFSWPDFLLAAGVLFFLALLRSPRSRGYSPFLFGALLLLHILAALYLWYRHLETGPFYRFLGLEAACLSAAVLCYIAAKRLWMKGILLLLEFSLLVTLSIMHIDMPKWGVLIILAAGFLFLAEIGSPSARSLIPVFAAMMLLFALFPVKDTPIRWETFQKAADLISEKTHALIVSLKYSFSGSGLYSVSFTGYGPGGELGGSLVSSGEPQISVRGSRTNKPLYLTGTIYNTYTGNGWEVQDAPSDYKRESYSLQYGKLASLFRNSALEETKAKATHTCHMDIEYEGLKTKSIFYAPNTWSFSFHANSERDMSGASLLLKRAKGVGFTYGLHFLEVDYSNENIQKLMAAGESKNLSSSDKDEKELDAYSQYSRENYSSLPDSLPTRVRSLAEELTANCPSDYDKLKAIETYLGSFPYTTRPKTPAKEQDFTEAFLFDTREGYCTYFATAMAVLGRCAGIPTRYVEGFATKNTCTSEDQNVYLSGQNAHAWAEAYLEPVGWVIFDATPGYHQSSNAVWNSQDAENTPAPADTQPDNQPPASQKESDESEGAPVPAISGKLAAFLPVFAKAAGVCLLLLCLLALTLFVRTRLGRHFYRKLTDYEKVIRLMEHILLIGKWKGYSMESWETLSDYENRLCGALDTENISFREINSLFGKIRFGSKAVEPQSMAVMEAYTLALQKSYLQSCGKIKSLSFLFKC